MMFSSYKKLQIPGEGFRPRMLCAWMLEQMGKSQPPGDIKVEFNGKTDILTYRRP